LALKQISSSIPKTEVPTNLFFVFFPGESRFEKKALALDAGKHRTSFFIQKRSKKIEIIFPTPKKEILSFSLNSGNSFRRDCWALGAKRL
jgi:hypothetical protein